MEPLTNQPSPMGKPRCCTTVGFDRALAMASVATSDPFIEDITSEMMPNTAAIPRTSKTTSNPTSNFHFLASQLLDCAGICGVIGHGCDMKVVLPGSGTSE